MTTDLTPHVYSAIAAVMADMTKEGISKDSKNQQQGYAFRGIDAYPSYIFVSTGDIYSLRTNKFLIPLRVPNGYTHVVLCDNGKKTRLSVHRLIAEAFYGKPTADMVAHHKNGIRNDNHANNLEWVTPSKNTQHAYDMGARVIDNAHRSRTAKLGRQRRITTSEQEAQIRIEYKGMRGDITRIANKTGLSRDVIRRVLEAK